MFARKNRKRSGSVSTVVAGRSINRLEKKYSFLWEPVSVYQWIGGLAEKERTKRNRYE
ncbi:hypothetical protein [uncultured Bacteroides sp.]|uniref:hypothetical protein n=1 Tax=uncultured Bacteroides sp. TaxID=162156 RepID=UPI00280B62D7|nr:hypothetical protein [uncultured Bacteroides sp.]